MVFSEGGAVLIGKFNKSSLFVLDVDDFEDVATQTEQVV